MEGAEQVIMLAIFSFQVECLFLVLTHIGRDLMAEAPGQMTLILSCLREAFLMADAPPQVSSYKVNQW